jgi:hypothetical protein
VTHFPAYALCLAPWTIALVAAHAFLVHRGRDREAHIVGPCALPATLFTCAGMLLVSTRHWLMGSSLAVLCAALVACGLFSRQMFAVIPGSVGLLFGVGAAASTAYFSYAAIELLLALAVLATLLVLGATTKRSTEFVRSFSRRWVDAATLFVLTAIPVAASSYRFRLPTDPMAIANELALGVLAFVVAHAWRRPEAAAVAAGWMGRATLAFIAHRLPDVSAVHGLQILAGVSVLPVLLWSLMPLVPLERRIVAAKSPGVLWALVSVWTIQAFGAWKHGRHLTGIENDVRALVTTLLLLLVPWIAAVIVGLRVGAPRRSATPAVAA